MSQVKNFETFERTYNHRIFILTEYSDLSVKYIAQKKKNDEVMLVKAFPTSHQKEKYFYNTELSLNMDNFVALLNCLKKMGSISSNQQEHIIVCSYENYKKEKLRLVIQNTDYGGRQIVVEKKVVNLPEEDLIFDADEEDAPATSTGSGVVHINSEKWEKQWGGFFLKKTDNLPKMVGVMEDFLHIAEPSAYIIPTPTKKRGAKGKSTQKSQAKKAKTTTTTTVSVVPDADDFEEDFDDDVVEKYRSLPKKRVELDSECEFYNIINKNALVELFNLCIRNDKTPKEIICAYGNEINRILNECDHVDFNSMIRNRDYNPIQQIDSLFHNQIKKQM